MRVVSFDIEIFADLFTIVSHDCYTNETWELAIGLDESKPYEKLRDYFERMNADMFVGYNSIGFDMPVIHYALNTSASVSQIADFANGVIKYGFDDNAKKFKYANKQKYSPFKSKSHIDLFLQFNTVDRVSLKRLMVTLNWPVVQDLPFPPMSYVADHKEDVIWYNHNDTAFTKHLYHVQYEEVKLRFEISRQYNIDVISASRSVMGGKLMEKLYLEEHPEISRWDLREMGTKYNQIHFKDVVSDKIAFENPQLKGILERLKNYTAVAADRWVTEKDCNFQELFEINGTRYTMGLGGLHSVNTPELLYSGQGVRIIDADVASFYPQNMINLGIYPKHLGEGFLVLYKRIVSQRLAAKKQGIKLTADALKITINSIFGKMGSSEEWFEDMMAMYKVTLNGQLMLLMLIDRLTAKGIEVFYANTDGITAVIKNDAEAQIWKEECGKWQYEMNLTLEFQEIEKMMLKDVSNYTLLKKNGDPRVKYDVKEKGSFAREVDITKRRDAQIVPIAVHNWFYHNIPIEKTIRESDDISEFVMTVKVGNQFKPVFHRIVMENGEPVKKEEPAQRVNRYYASYGMKAGSLLKKKANGKYQAMLKDSAIALSNDWNQPQIAPVNYAYYIERAANFIAPFTVTQTTLAL